MRKYDFDGYFAAKRTGCVLYRAASRRDETGTTSIHVHAIPIVRYTACGAWISEFGYERFVNLRAVKQYASVTKGEAYEQLKHRKRRQVAILRAMLEDAEQALAVLEAGKMKSTFLEKF